MKLIAVFFVNFAKALKMVKKLQEAKCVCLLQKHNSTINNFSTDILGLSDVSGQDEKPEPLIFVSLILTI